MIENLMIYKRPGVHPLPNQLKAGSQASEAPIQGASSHDQGRKEAKLNAMPRCCKAFKDPIVPKKVAKRALHKSTG